MEDVAQQLLAEVIAHADDDVPRFVFADWLEERGDARAEFIRGQCELARRANGDGASVSPCDGGNDALAEHIHELEHSNSHQWASDFNLPQCEWEFRRGFVEWVEAPVSTFVEQHKTWLQATPLRELSLLCNGKPATELATCGYLGAVERLAIRRAMFTEDQMREFLTWEGIEGVAKLELTGCAYHPRALELIPKSRSLDGLKSLNISGRGAEPVLAAMADTIYLRELESFTMRRCRIGAAGLRRIVSFVERHPACTRLDFRFSTLGSGVAEVFAESSVLGRLTAIDFGVQMTSEDIQLLCDALMRLEPRPAITLQTSDQQSAMLVSNYPDLAVSTSACDD